jgi:uncharacterized protein (DUF58 family)
MSSPYSRTWIPDWPFMSVVARQLVDPAFFSRLENIELRARSIVEGFLTGLHRSPYVGFSVEFASHREYVAGDDPRHVNWKIYARQGRLYVKEYSAETNLNLYLMLDVSSSMECANTGVSKRTYAAALAAALAVLALKQQDAVGITLFADRVTGHLAPRAKARQLDEILKVIEASQPSPVTDTYQGLSQAAEMASHRGMVVIISDFFGDPPQLLKRLEQFRYRNHEVLLFHIWDRYERDLPIEGHVSFYDLETNEQLTTQAEAIREAYQQAVNSWREQIRQGCLKQAIDRVELTTDEPLDQALLDYLVRRAKSFG